MLDLPVTERIRSRPVYLRFLKRMNLEDLEEPTEDEIRDAILLLKDPWVDWLHVEAFRILDEVGQ